ncbi:MAG: hypothetical protein ABIR77_05640, partial [Sphingomicrobium sp.]
GLAFAGLVDEHVLMVGQRVSEIDAARASTAQALGWIAAHPLRYLGSVALQFGRAMALDIAGIQQYHWFVPPPPQAIASAIMTACQLCWIALWIVVGKALRTSGTSRDLNFAFLGAVALQLLLVNGWLQFHERHRYLATPLLILIAVRGWRQNDLRAAPPSPARSSRTSV